MIKDSNGLEQALSQIKATVAWSADDLGCRHTRKVVYAGHIGMEGYRWLGESHCHSAKNTSILALSANMPLVVSAISLRITEYSACIRGRVVN